MTSAAAACPFVIGEKYTRNDIYEIMAVPEGQQRGNWETGYTRWGNDLFMFPTVGSEATGGFDYDNRWDGEHFVWYAKNGTVIGQKQIQWILNEAERVFVFTRPAVRSPFTFEGLGRVRKAYDESPVRIDWEIVTPETDFEPPEEIGDASSLKEGAIRQVAVNAYERNGAARRACLSHYGYDCCVCGFNFGQVYGEIGEGFIHVHHLRELSSIGEEYEIDPIADLRPVCPNCHAMLHSRSPLLTIGELKDLRR